MIRLEHRSTGASGNVWEFDPLRGHAGGGLVEILVHSLAVAIPVCSPERYARCVHAPGDHNHACFCGYEIAPVGNGWLIAAARFHALLPRAALLLAGAPGAIDRELRAVFDAHAPPR